MDPGVTLQMEWLYSEMHVEQVWGKVLVHFKRLRTISNKIEVYEEPVPRTKKISHCAVKVEAGEENRILNECLYWS